MGRIECGGGEGGEPALCPPGWQSYASRARRSHSVCDVGVCRSLLGRIVGAGIPPEKEVITKVTFNTESALSEFGEQAAKSVQTTTCTASSKAPVSTASHPGRRLNAYGS